MIWNEPNVTSAPVKTVEQLPDDSVHEAVEGVRDPRGNPNSVKLTVPEGDDPLTVAVQVVLAPTSMDEGEQSRVVVVVA